MIHSDVYKSIRDRLWDAGIGIKHIDIWMGQPERYQQEEVMPFDRPAAFIEFGTSQAKLLGNRRYELLYNINIHLLQDIISETSRLENDSPEFEVDFAFARLELIDLIVYHLTEYANSAVGMGAMQWSGCAINNEDLPMTHDVITFTVRLVSDVAKKELIKVKPQSIVTASFNQ